MDRSSRSFMSKKTGDNILRSFRQYGLSFLFLNAIAALFAYIIYPMLSNKYTIPIEVCFSCGNLNYFIFFGEELSFLIGGTLIGLLASIGLIKFIETNDLEPIFKFISNPLIYTILLFTPILVFFIQMENGNILIYDGTFDRTLGRFTIFLLFIVFNYSFFILMHERGKYLQNPLEYKPLLILARKTPYLINYWIFTAIMLNMPFSGRSFLRNSLSALTPLNSQNPFDNFQITPISLPGGILVFSLFILIMQLFYSIIHYLVYKEEEFDERVVITNNNVSLIKKILFYLFLLFLLFVFVIQILFIAMGLSVINQNSVYFLQNPFFVNFDEINLPPSSSHWFGTDQNGRDLFARTLMSLSSFILFIFLFSIIKFRISMDFMNVTSNNVTTSTKKEIFQIIGNIPRIPVLILIAISLKFVATSFIFYFLIILYLSLSTWAKVADMVERNNVHENRNKISYLTHPIILYTFSSMMIDLSVLSFFTHFPGLLTFGNVLQDAMSNQPLEFWWGWSIPIVLLVLFISFLRSSKLRT